jgi:hypothetical protein
MYQKLWQASGELFLKRRVFAAIFFDGMPVEFETSASHFLMINKMRCRCNFKNEGLRYQPTLNETIKLLPGATIPEL